MVKKYDQNASRSPSETFLWPEHQNERNEKKKEVREGDGEQEVK